MPYKEHGAIETPPNGSTPIWRFMDFTKFVDLLVTSKLFFPRLAVLADPFEGFIGRRSLEWIRTSPDFREEEGMRVSDYLEALRDSRESMFVSCWHMNTHESAAMWRLYLKSDEGIAVRSSIERMKDAFDLAPQDIYLGRMVYQDFDRDVMVPGNVFRLALLKRRSFEHEREVRAIVDWLGDRSERPPHGIHVQVALPSLIECVYVAPGSADWLLELVKSVTHRLGLDVPVVRSSLDDRPLY